MDHSLSLKLNIKNNSKRTLGHELKMSVVINYFMNSDVGEVHGSRIFH